MDLRLISVYSFPLLQPSHQSCGITYCLENLLRIYGPQETYCKTIFYPKSALIEDML